MRAALSAILWLLAPGAAFANSLALGGASRAAGAVEIPISEPVYLNFKTREEIFALRSAAVAAQPLLSDGRYSPSEAMFGQMQSGRPWWGEDGLFFYAEDPKWSIQGRSERSRVVVNPFLLVDCEEAEGPFAPLHGLPAGRLFAARTSDRDFSYFPHLSRLLWHPAQKKAEVTYLVSDFAKFIGKYAKRTFSPGEMALHFRVTNARDWGFEYVYFDMRNSSNLAHPGWKNAAIRTRSYIHTGGTCGYSGGCNNISPLEPELSGVRIAKLPAAARLLFWRAAPLSPASPPDFVFDVKFQ
ncbi:MAG: hypothetical protein WC421_04380 [Elusimicrobiales bacterium]